MKINQAIYEQLRPQFQQWVFPPGMEQINNKYTVLFTNLYCNCKTQQNTFQSFIFVAYFSQLPLRRRMHRKIHQKIRFNTVPTRINDKGGIQKKRNFGYCPKLAGPPPPYKFGHQNSERPNEFDPLPTQKEYFLGVLCLNTCFNGI